LPPSRTTWFDLYSVLLVALATGAIGGGCFPHLQLMSIAPANFRVAVCVAALLLWTAPFLSIARARTAGQAAAATAAPSPAPAIAAGAYDNEPLTRAAAGSSGAKSAPTGGLSAGASGLDLPRICYSLALVLGLVVLLRWGARWVFPSTMMARRSGAIRLLARTPLGPKQQVMLIAVGRRVLVVADNGQQMTRLTEITESEEISGLTADLAQARVAHEAEKDHEEAERAFAHELNDAQSRRDEQKVTSKTHPAAAADQLEKPAGASIPATALALKPALPAPSPVSPLPAAADHPAARLAAKLFDRMRAPKSAEAAPPGPPASSPKLPQTDAQPKMTPEFQATLFATEQEQSNRTKGDGLGDLAQRIRAMSRQFNRK